MDEGGCVLNGVRTPVFLNAIAVKQDIPKLTAQLLYSSLILYQERRQLRQVYVMLMREEG